MKKLITILMILLSAAVLTACTKENTAKSPETQKEDNTGAKVQEGAGEAASVTEAAQTENNSPDNQSAEKLSIKIAALKGPTAIGMVKLMDDAAAKTTKNNYNFDVVGTADVISAGLLKGEFDIAAVPCNLASVLYNKTKGKIKLAGINTLGVLYIVETGDSIHSVEDLKGRTIYSTGIGTTPQYTLNYLLKAHGLDPEKDVNIVYKTEPTEVAALLSKSKDAVAMLPQPYVTTVMMNNDKVRIALDAEKEWEAVSTDNSKVVTGVVVVRSDFLEKNKEAVDAFMTEYAASASYVNTNVEDASKLVEKFDIFKAAVAKQAIPKCNITLLQGNEMKEKASGYLSALYAQNPESVGGKLPADDFYYIP